MPDDPASRTRQRLQALRESFKVNLDDMITRIATDWRAIPGATDQAVILEGFRALYSGVHRVTGSAGSFGYRAVSEAAAPLEVLLGRVREADELPGREAWDQIELFVAQLVEVWRRQQHLDPALDNDSTGLRRAAFDPGLIYTLGDDAHSTTLAGQLTPFGYQLTHFSHEQGLIDACRQDPPGVLLWLAPVAQLGPLKADLGDVPVLILADSTAIEQRLAAVRVGAQGYLHNPPALADLVVWLEQLTRRGSQPGEPYRVLIVDDDQPLAESYRLVLQMAGISATVLNEPLRVLDVLATEKPDLILMDHHMPDCSGVELVQVIRQHLSYLSIPIVFLSVETDRQQQLNARILGGDDFLRKPVSAWQLVQVVGNRAERSRTLRSALRLDGLTGLPNQTGIRERLEVELLRARRQTIPLSLALVDLDRFRDFNQRHGHYQGDQVLKTLTRLLTRRLRRTDIVGRYGGGEFAIILNDTGAAAAREVIDEIRQLLSMVDLGVDETGIPSLTFSAGVADNRIGDQPGPLLAASRQALRQAKAAGGDRVVSNSHCMTVE